MTWPYPGDSAIVRSRRVALAYRQRLQQVAPQACAELDDIMRQLGQGWAIPRPVVADPDAYIKAADAADLAVISMSALRKARGAGVIAGRLTAGRWYYRVGDIMALSAKPRTRKRNGEQ